MPIYEYRCDNCGTKFEKLVRSSTAVSELGCPSCGDTHLSRELSTFAALASNVSKQAEAPVCPSGRCSNPGLCGMN